MKRIPTWARFALLAGGSAVFGLVVVRRIDLAQTGRALGGADPVYLALMVLVSLLANFILGSDKWVRIVATLGCRIPFLEGIFIRVASSPVKFLLPLKSGEMIKAVYLERVRGFPLTLGASTVLYDKATNLAGIFVLVTAGAAVSGRTLPPGLAVVILVSAAAVAVWLPLRSRAAALALRMGGRLGAPVERLMSVFHRLSLPAQFGFLAYAVIFECSEIASTLLALRALGVEIPAEVVLGVVPLVIAAANLPISLAGLGTREALYMLMFAPYGPAEKLVAVGFLVTVIEYLLIVIAGLPLAPIMLHRMAAAGRSTSDAGSS